MECCNNPISGTRHKVPGSLRCPQFQVNWTWSLFVKRRPATKCSAKWLANNPQLFCHCWGHFVVSPSGRGQGRGAVPLQPCAKKSQFNLISAYFFRCYSIEFDCPADAGAEYQKKNTKEKKSKWRKALKTWVFTWVFIWKALKLSWLIHQ